MIQDSVNKVVYEGNGEATEFFYPFVITKNTDVKVMTVSPEGAETVLTNDYYVDTERSTVVYPGWVSGEEPGNQGDFSPLKDGWKLVVYREVGYTQEVAMLDQHPFNVLETMIDKTTILTQQLKDVTDRSMKLSMALAIDGVDMTVPYEAGKSFRWSETERKLETTEDPAYVRKVVENLASQVREQSTAAVTSAQMASTAASTAVTAQTSAVNAEANAKIYMETTKGYMETTKGYMETTKGYMETTEGYMNSASVSATKAAASESASYKNSLSANTYANNAADSATEAGAHVRTASSYADVATNKATEAVAYAADAEASAERASNYADIATVGQVQADWDETDSTSKAYIKNAPRFIAVAERVRGEDEPTYGITSEMLLSDGTLATDATVLSVDVEGTSYAVGDQYSIETE